MSGLNFITTDPPNAGVAVDDQDGSLLSQSSMYMRNNFPIPSTAPSGFSIVVPGQPTRHLSVRDLAEFEPVSLDMVLECAGNGRILMDPIPDGTPWDLGGASAVSVAGVRLADVLGELPEEVNDVVFTGADTGRVEPEGEIPYQFSLSRAMAMSETPLLVTHIGGEPLSLEHGAPVRLMVPGHFAMKAVKWLTRIEGVLERFTGHFVNKYRYFGDVEEPESSPVSVMQVRSVIAAPRDGEELEAGPLEVSGSAWTGRGVVERVQVSVDEGLTWIEASVARSAGGATGWSAEFTVEPGDLTVMARASDSDGAVQPLVPRWNRNGYANNVVHRVRVRMV